jgi:hypothetical protein
MNILFSRRGAEDAERANYRIQDTGIRIQDSGEACRLTNPIAGPRIAECGLK